jgi:hypothetical protein
MAFGNDVRCPPVDEPKSRVVQHAIVSPAELGAQLPAHERRRVFDAILSDDVVSGADRGQNAQRPEHRLARRLRDEGRCRASCYRGMVFSWSSGVP